MCKSHAVYLDYQATTPVAPEVLESMKPYFMENYGNPHSEEHVLGWSAAKAVDRAAQEVAALIGADSDEIIFCSGATEANNLAILGAARRSKKRKRILVSAIEHKSVLAAVHVLEKEGFIVDMIPVLPTGLIDIGWLNESVGEDVLLVSVMAVNNETGTIQPLQEIGKIVSESGAYFHCDAAQAPTAIDLDVFDSRIDLLSLSGHKMYAPKGIGVLYVRRKISNQIEPLIYGGGQQRGLRSGTLPTPLCVGLGTAASVLSSNTRNDERRRVRRLRDRLVLGLQGVVKCTWNGVAGDLRHPGNANLCFEGFVAQDILMALQPQICASTGSACNSGVVESSYTLRAIGLSEEQANASIRFSVGRFTTEQEIDCSIEAISEALSGLIDSSRII